MAIRTSSGIPLYFSSARTDGKVSKLHDEVFIFSIMRAGESFAFTMVTMSALVSLAKPSWAKAKGTKETERASVRRTDRNNLGMEVLSR
jgi:hypothetical protein